MSEHVYSNAFYDYIEQGAVPSALALVGLVSNWLKPHSVLDVGCGRGIWLKIWKEHGAADILGIDGAYVDALRLHVASSEFHAAELAAGFTLGRRFDLVQSLEVAEHLPQLASERFVASLVAHADIVLFSAAVPGQGGENHQNERPLSFWRELFARRGYQPYDAVRPILAERTEIEPWYRYNTIIYANEAGAARLPIEVSGTHVADDRPFAEFGDFNWRLRRAAVGLLPRIAVDYIARTRAARIAKRVTQASA